MIWLGSILVLLTLFLLYSLISYSRTKAMHGLETLLFQRTNELLKEREKSENLLARVLPQETADELKQFGKIKAQKFQMVTVLFSDIQGFTKITDDTDSEELIDQLDRFVYEFDSVVQKYHIEKIKTVGDAYMCAGGLPKKNRTNPIEVVVVALEMMSWMKETNRRHQKGDVWELRMGIDTGPVIAGVVGQSKISYDIWGATVNTASRMESAGEAGKINISENTYLLVRDFFICTYRGQIPVKNRGNIQMYFVEGILPNLSQNLEGTLPNQDFFIELQLIRLSDLEELVLEKLEQGLPKNLYYHNVKHTVDVYTQVELIGRAEGVSKEDLLLLRTAALFHDAGHLVDYATHEQMGVKLAREILPNYRYSSDQIDEICKLIMSTKLPPNPKNLLEEIICDADLDYLGRTDFIPVSNMLYKEMHENGMIGSLHEWNILQMNFIQNHQYFTQTARRLRNVNKDMQLQNIKSWINQMEKSNL